MSQHIVTFFCSINDLYHQDRHEFRKWYIFSSKFHRFHFVLHIQKKQGERKCRICFRPFENRFKVCPGCFCEEDLWRFETLNFYKSLLKTVKICKYGLCFQIFIKKISISYASKFQKNFHFCQKSDLFWLPYHNYLYRNAKMAFRTQKRIIQDHLAQKTYNSGPPRPEINPWVHTLGQHAEFLCYASSVG